MPRTDPRSEARQPSSAKRSRAISGEAKAGAIPYVRSMAQACSLVFGS